MIILLYFSIGMLLSEISPPPPFSHIEHVTASWVQLQLIRTLSKTNQNVKQNTHLHLLQPANIESSLVSDTSRIYTAYYMCKLISSAGRKCLNRWQFNISLAPSPMAGGGAWYYVCQFSHHSSRSSERIWQICRSSLIRLGASLDSRALLLLTKSVIFFCAEA